MQKPLFPSLDLGYCCRLPWLVLLSTMTIVAVYHDYCCRLSWLLLPSTMTIVAVYHDYCCRLSWLLLLSIMSIVTVYHDYCGHLTWLLLPLNIILLPSTIATVSAWNDYCCHMQWLVCCHLTWLLLPSIMPIVCHLICYPWPSLVRNLEMIYSYPVSSTYIYILPQYFLARVCGCMLVGRCQWSRIYKYTR